MLRRSYLTLGLMCALPLAAQTAPHPSDPAVTKTEVKGTTPAQDSIELKLLQLQKDLRERDAIIRNLLGRVQDLERKVNGTTPTPVATSASLNSVSANTSTTEVAISEEGYNEDERRARAALDRALVSRGGLLLRSGTVEVGTGISYFNSSASAISINGFSILPVLVVGNIVSDRVRSDILLSSVTTRLGLPHNFQVDFQVPYGYELQRTVTADNKQSSHHANGLGDLDLGLSRQLTKERGSVPDLLASLDFKTKTGSDPFNLGNNEVALGTGFYGLRGRLTAVKSSDPIVFYGGLAYTRNFPGNKLIPDSAKPGAQVLARFRPGDTVGLQLGSVLAVSPEASITLGVDQSFTRATRLNGQSIAGTYLSQGVLRVGTSYIFAPAKTIDVSLGVGLTSDVPSLQLTVGLPLRFSLWKPDVKK